MLKIFFQYLNTTQIFEDILLTCTPGDQLLEMTNFIASKKKVLSIMKMLLLHYSEIVWDHILLGMFHSATLLYSLNYFLKRTTSLNYVKGKKLTVMPDMA